ncbi:MAG: hypothetical protein IJA11_08820 [Oscillospiraceae bacterium]|nr:hypothetical protein [Oscillospiraceae bacterium]
MISREIGTPSGDVKRDVQELYDYIAYLTEQLEYSNGLIEKRIKLLEKGEETE